MISADKSGTTMEQKKIIEVTDAVTGETYVIEVGEGAKSDPDSRKKSW